MHAFLWSGTECWQIKYKGILNINKSRAVQNFVYACLWVAELLYEYRRRHVCCSLVSLTLGLELSLFRSFICPCKLVLSSLLIYASIVYRCVGITFVAVFL